MLGALSRVRVQGASLGSGWGDPTDVDIGRPGPVHGQLRVDGRRGVGAVAAERLVVLRDVVQDLVVGGEQDRLPAMEGKLLWSHIHVFFPIFGTFSVIGITHLIAFIRATGILEHPKQASFIVH